MSTRIVPRNKKPKAAHVQKFPPSISLLPVQSMVFRFISTSSTGFTVYRRSLLSLIMSQSVTLVLQTVFQSVLLKKVEIWGAPLTNDINFSTCSLEWEDPRGALKVITDSGTTSSPAHVCCKPPKNSTAALWSSLNTTFINEALFFAIAPLGSIIDVTINFIMGNGTTNNVTYITRTTGSSTLGLYYLALDNSSSGGSAGTLTMTPVGSVQTVSVTS